ncbi:hypothetical protein ALT_1252 [Aspergillus lentulus]|uniref:chitinase n=1 Tax=Aspergillus lentulus TaxID=293939 RepID=A0AAN4T7E4_ASPLE|nr:hypothetical protein ALT_1252 [Aspergillus lentulus]
MHFELSNRSDGPLRVPGMSGIPLHHELPVGQRFAHAVADWRRDPRLTKPEMSMLHFMEYVTEQPGWEDSIESDVPIMEQWQRKAFSTFDLTPRAWEWCLAELKDKAWEFKRTDYVTIKDGDSPVAKSDRLVSYSLLQNLREELQPLLDDQTASFDESGKSSPLRHLVDPSLHPLVYERTNVLVDGGRHWLDPAGPSLQTSVRKLPRPTIPPQDSFDFLTPKTDYENPYGHRDDERGETKASFFSDKFQWLPCEVEFQDGPGRPRIGSYINNLPWTQNGAYKAFEELLAQVIPLWNEVLVIGTQGRKPMRIRTYDIPQRHKEEAIQKRNDLIALYRSPRSAFTDQQWSELCAKVRPYLALPKYDNLKGLRVNKTPDEFPADILGSLTDEQWNSPKTLIKAVEEKIRRRNVFELPEPGISFTYEEWKRGKNTGRPVMPRVNISEPNQPFDPIPDHEYYCINLTGIGDGLQVIFKVSSVDLTPDRPFYEGDSDFQVAGMLNERIVATAVCYYDVDNIDGARISFQQEARLNEYEFNLFHPNKIELAWDIPHWDYFARPPPSPPQALQDLGSIATTSNGRLLAWPNTLRYKAEPFSLVDSSRPGHLRYITIHLVDPHYRICSTRNVPPQQHDWWPKTMEMSNNLHGAPLLRLETEDLPMTIQESLEVQKKTNLEREKAMEKLLCCSKYGFCGTTKEFCGEKDTIKRPSCDAASGSIDRVVGYCEQWSIKRHCEYFRPEDISAGYYTHVNFAFASINPETFEVVEAEPWDDVLWERMRSLRLEQPSVEIWVALGGWLFNDPDQPTKSTFSDIAGSEENQKKFAKSLLAMMSKYGFDGSIPLRKSTVVRKIDNFPKWMRNLRSQLQSSGKKYRLTLTLPASYWYLQHFDIKRLQESINWFNAMSYSMHSTWDQNNTWVGPFLNPHTNLTEIKGALDLIWRNDIKPAKVTMGLAYYSRSFTLSSPDCFEPGCTYKSGGNAGQCSSTVGFLLNSEIQTIINENGLTPRFYEEDAVKAIHWGAVMVWEISHDDHKSTSAEGLMTGLGKKRMQLTSYSAASAVPSTLTKRNDSAGSNVDVCRWTNCGENCPAGWKWIRRADSDTLSMTDETYCYSGQDSRKFCCPGDVDLPSCQWRGMPKHNGNCSPGCKDGEVEVGTLGYPNCQTVTPSTAPYGECKWVGSAGLCSSSGGHKDCPSDYPTFVFAGSNSAGGEQTCTHGAKSFCCHQFLRAETFCESSCPEGQTRLGMHAGDCGLRWEAYCCAGDPPPPPKTDDGGPPAPSAAGNHYYATELAEFARTLYDQGYLGAQAFRLIYPGSDNPLEFHTSQYQQFREGMNRNFLMVEREIMAGWTEKSNLATTRHLLNRNVSPDEPYSDPPLSMAIRHQRLDIVQLLYEYNIKGFMDEFNRTEIHIATRVGNLAILEFIWNKLKPQH